MFSARSRVFRLRLPEVARRGLRPARLSIDLAARAPRPRVPLLAAERAADGLLPARLADPRGPAAGDRGPAGRRQPQPGRLLGRASRRRRVRAQPRGRSGGANRPRLRDRAQGRGGARAWSPSAISTARTASSGSSPHAARSAPARSSVWRWPGPANASDSPSASDARPVAARYRAGGRARPALPAVGSAAGPEAARDDVLGAGDRRLRVDRRHPRRAPDGTDARGARGNGHGRPSWRPTADRSPIEIAGMMIARQKPATAKGVVFILLEDEYGNRQRDRPSPGLRA